jgi:GDP-4-dehydro-6-deoxy-D-mannose reductase
VEVTVQTDPSRLRPSDVPRFVGDPARLVAWIGWRPETALARSLDDLLAWWRERVARGLPRRAGID